jgi:RNA polymerase sigma-32 factor
MRIIFREFFRIFETPQAAIPFPPVNANLHEGGCFMASRQPQNLMIRAAMREPLLERAEEHALALRWKELKDQEAMNKIVTAHMRLVISMASRFRQFGLPLSDLIQEGHVGLLEAVSRFEPEREVRFSTYATWWIRASIQDYVLRNWSIVRGGTSAAQKSLFFNLRRLRARLSKGQESISESILIKSMAQSLGLPEKDVELMNHRLSAPDTSLQAPLSNDGEGGAQRMDFLEDSAPLPDSAAAESIDGERRVKWVSAALTVLDRRELLIIKERRLAEDGATLEHLGVKLGISKERVRQIETRAMIKLKCALLSANQDLAREAASV